MRGRPQRPPTGIETVMQVFARRFVAYSLADFTGQAPPFEFIAQDTLRGSVPPPPQPPLLGCDIPPIPDQEPTDQEKGPIIRTLPRSLTISPGNVLPGMIAHPPPVASPLIEVSSRYPIYAVPAVADHQDPPRRSSWTAADIERAEGARDAMHFRIRQAYPLSQ